MELDGERRKFLEDLISHSDGVLAIGISKEGERYSVVGSSFNCSILDKIFMIETIKKEFLTTHHGGSARKEIGGTE